MAYHVPASIRTVFDDLMLKLDRVRLDSTRLELIASIDKLLRESGYGWNAVKLMPHKGYAVRKRELPGRWSKENVKPVLPTNAYSNLEAHRTRMIPRVEVQRITDDIGLTVRTRMALRTLVRQHMDYDEHRERIGLHIGHWTKWDMIETALMMGIDILAVVRANGGEIKSERGVSPTPLEEAITEQVKADEEAEVDAALARLAARETIPLPLAVPAAPTPPPVPIAPVVPVSVIDTNPDSLNAKEFAVHASEREDFSEGERRLLRIYARYNRSLTPEEIDRVYDAYTMPIRETPIREITPVPFPVPNKPTTNSAEPEINTDQETKH